MKPITVTQIEKKVFDGLVQNTRSPYLDFFGQELLYFANESRTILGTILQDKIDKDYVAIMLGRDENGKFRAFNLQTELLDIPSSIMWLTNTIKWYTGLGKTIFPQGDPLKTIMLFDTKLPIEKQHPYFVTVNSSEAFLAAKEIINSIMPYFVDIDGNFVEQFQTTGFDARIWELYLFACFIEDGFEFDRRYDRPDFIINKFTDKIAVEAVTLGRKDSPAKSIHLDPDYFINLPNTIKDMDQMAIKFGSCLYTKLQKKYWELPQVKDIPLIIAIADFHEDMSMTWSSNHLISYLYGVTHTARYDENGNQIIEVHNIDFHEFDGKKIPSGFFNQPGSENISGVLFCSSGTISKFNRMGKQMGFGLKNVKMYRMGACYNDTPNASKPKFYKYEVNESSNEDWQEGLELFHNPNALKPIDMDIFPHIAHHFFFKNGNIESHMRKFHPYNSYTMNMIIKE